MKKRITAVSALVVVSALCLTGCLALDYGYGRYEGRRSAQDTHVYINNDNLSTARSTAAGGDRRTSSRSRSSSSQRIQVDTRNSVESLLMEVRTAYRQGKYSGVMNAVRGVLSYDSASPRQMAEALVYAGAMEFAMGDRVAAYGYFKKAVSYDAEILPGDDIRTSAMLEVFMEARRDVTGR
jgi:hypothetical protein